MNRPSVALRDARASDAAAMHAIEVASFGDPWSAESFRAMLAHPAMRARVAVRGDDVVGYSVAWIIEDEAELANIAVAPAARRGGLGGRLLDDLIAACAARSDAHVIWLEVRDGNAAARALYASRGFVEAGRRKGYYRAPVEDAVVMRRATDAASGRSG